jgi:hypothetical protein
MPVDRDKFISRLKKMGIDQIELKLVQDEFTPEELGIVQDWRSKIYAEIERKNRRQAEKDKLASDSAPNKTHKLAYWAIFVAVSSVIVAILAWQFPKSQAIPSESEITANPSEMNAALENLVETETAAKVQLDTDDDPAQRADALHAFITESHPEISSFKFVDTAYDPEGGPGGLNWAPLYQATRSAYRKIDRILCSYPDATYFESNFNDRYIFTVCGFPASMRPELQTEGQPKHSYLQFRIYFFDTDRHVVENLSCECEWIAFRDARLDFANQTVSMAVNSDSVLLEVESAFRESIVLSGLRSQGRERDYTPLTISFDQNWVPVKVVKH